MRFKFYGCEPRMRHSKRIHVHGEVHGGPGEGGKEVTFCGHDICMRAWHEIFAVSKSSFYRNRFEFITDVCSKDHGNLNLKWNRVATLQATTTLNKLLQDKVDMMPHKSRLSPTVSGLWKWCCPMAQNGINSWGPSTK